MTNSVQITNVGGQPLPVIQGILEFPCSKHILLHSSESQETANKIATLMQCNCQLQPIKDPNNFQELLSLIGTLVDKNEQVSLFVNVTGGTKIMTLALYTFFANSNLIATVFHIDQNGMIHYLAEMKSESIKTTLPIDRFIAFSGQKIKSKTCDEAIPAEYFEVKDQIKKIYREHFNEFRTLLNRYRELDRKEDNLNDFEIVNRKTYSQLKWDQEENELSISLYRHNYRGYLQFSFTGSEYLGIVLETKWFELELVEIFRNWNKTRELAWGVIVPYIEGSDKNEIDIILNVGSKLLFVECKTQVSDIKDIDKLRNAAKAYGGLGSKAILITLFEANKRTIEKCNDNNILLFSFTNPDKSKNNQNDLYKLLDKEIIKSNTF